MDDFPVAELSDVWTDTQTGAFTDDTVYVVQTDTKVIARCLLMTTVPGDLVLDPTCGSDTAAHVEFWTSREVREIVKSHLDFVVAATKKWGQGAAYLICRQGAVDAFLKNDHVGFTIPYLHNGQPHDYVPDFIVRMKGRPSLESLHVILEAKGFDPLGEVEQQAAQRWVAAHNADTTYGR